MSANLGAFELDQVIGGGGMGLVYRAHHVDEDVDVAIKILTSARAREKWFREAFEREAALLARLNHPHIAFIHDVGVVDATTASKLVHLSEGSPWLAMEFIEGHQLTEPPATWPEIKTLLVDLLDALAHAHARGVLHRDLKPENIVRRPNGRLSLVDFGVGLALDDFSARALADDKVVGTPSYMAPEQIRSRPRDQGPWTDLYGVGCIAWWAVTGSRAFDGVDTREVFIRVLDAQPGTFDPRIAIPDGFESWVRRLIEPDFRRRYQRASDAAFDLLRIHRSIPEGDRDTIPEGLDGVEETIIESAHEAIARGEVSAVLSLLEDRPGDESDAPTAPPMPEASDMTLQTHQRAPLPGAGLGLFSLRTVPFVDRNDERRALWQNLFRVRRDGLSRSVALTGPPGTGKTRLAHWLATRGHELGVLTVVRAECAKQGARNDGLGGLVRDLFRCEGMSWDASYERIREAFAALGFAPDACEHFAHGMADLATPEQSPRASATFRTPAARNFAFLSLFRRLAADRVVMLWIENAEYPDDVLDLARYLKRESLVEVLIVCTMRETTPRDPWVQEVHSAISEARHVALEVGALAKEDHRTLVNQLLRLEPKLARGVVERTEGNPLFAVQVVGEWAARGLLQPGSRGFVLRPGAALEPPSSIREVWRLRIERVANRLAGMSADDVHSALEIAAVLGTTIAVDEWGEACQREGVPLAEGFLWELQREGLVRCDTREWAFAHGMLWEALVDRARDHGRLQHRHEAVAAVLRARYERPNITAQRRIGAHLRASNDHAAALEPLFVAAMMLVEREDYRQANEVLREHAAALDALDIPPTDRRATANHLLRARVAYEAGAHDEVMRLATSAFDISDKAGWDRETGEALRLLGNVLRDRGVLDQSLEMLTAAERHFAKLVEELAAVRVSKAGTLLKMGRLTPARRQLESALEIFERIDDTAMQAKVRHHVGYTWIAEGDYAEAGLQIDRALELARQVGNRALEAACLNNLGEVARFENRWHDAFQHYEQARGLWELVGHRDADVARLNAVTCAIAAGDFGAAQQAVDTFAPRLQKLGFAFAIPIANAQRACIAAAAGAYNALDQAISAVEASLAETGIVERDLAFLFTKAGELATAAPPELQARITALAVEQWEKLGDQAQARRLSNESD